MTIWSNIGAKDSLCEGTFTAPATSNCHKGSRQNGAKLVSNGQNRAGSQPVTPDPDRGMKAANSLLPRNPGTPAAGMPATDTPAARILSINNALDIRRRART